MISDHHPEYDRMLPIWRECRTALMGQAAVKSAEQKYLPATSGMLASWGNYGEAAYDSYRLRARFHDTPGESLEGALGVLFGQDPQGDLGEIVTNNEMSLYDLSREVARHVYGEGRRVLFEGAQGVLLDVDHGTYPYVTSSNASSCGIAVGTGCRFDITSGLPMIE